MAKKLTDAEIGAAQRAMSIDQCRRMILREKGPAALAKADREYRAGVKKKPAKSKPAKKK